MLERADRARRRYWSELFQAPLGGPRHGQQWCRLICSSAFRPPRLQSAGSIHCNSHFMSPEHVHASAMGTLRVHSWSDRWWALRMRRGCCCHSPGQQEKTDSASAPCKLTPPGAILPSFHCSSAGSLPADQRLPACCPGGRRQAGAALPAADAMAGTRWQCRALLLSIGAAVFGNPASTSCAGTRQFVRLALAAVPVRELAALVAGPCATVGRGGTVWRVQVQGVLYG